MNETDRKLIAECDPSVRLRRWMELAIAHRVIDALRRGGFDLHADNGEDRTTTKATDDQLIECLFACDEARLYATRDNERGLAFSGWVFFVLGNDGFDVVSDYTANLEEWLAPVNEYADTLAEGGLADLLQQATDASAQRDALQEAVIEVINHGNTRRFWRVAERALKLCGVEIIGAPEKWEKGDIIPSQEVR